MDQLHWTEESIALFLNEWHHSLRLRHAIDLHPNTKLFSDSYPDRFQISTNPTIHHHPTHRTNQSIVLVIVGRNNWNCDASKNISQMKRIHWPLIANTKSKFNGPKAIGRWPPDNEFICSITREMGVRARFTNHRLIITRFDACNIRWWTEQGRMPIVCISSVGGSGF